jgi:prephenate dehydrogenase
MGLIGGSLGRAILKKTEHTVFGADTDESALVKADMLEAHTKALEEKDIGGLDLVILALNPSSATAVMRGLAPKLKNGACVIDTCGVKRVIVKEMQKLSQEYPQLFFAGAHPMAGREFSGIAHSQATLFEKAYVIIVPVTKQIEKLSEIKKLFTDIGAQDVEICSADKHDKMISYTSQLAHIVSSAYVKNNRSSEHAGFSAGSFRDLTRVAKLNPDMWTELFLDNKDYLASDIEFLIERLTEYRDAVKDGDADRLRSLLAEGVEKKEQAENARKERLK